MAITSSQYHNWLHITEVVDEDECISSENSPNTAWGPVVGNDPVAELHPKL